MRAVLWFFVGCLFGALPVIAFAEDYPALSRYDASWDAQLHGTPSELCAVRSVIYPGVSYVSAGVYGPYNLDYGHCRDSGNVARGGVTQVFYCPGGGIIAGNTCSNAPACPSGQVRDAQTGLCIDPPCQSGAIASSGYFPIGNDPNQSLSFPGYACINGCGAIFDGSSPGARQLVNSKYFYYAKGQYINTGETCSGSAGPSAQGALPPPSCASGDVMGTVNGQSVCVTKGTGQTVNPHSPQQGPTTTTTNNGDGTTTVKTDDPNGGGTVTTSGPGGSTTTNTPGLGGSGDGQSGNGGSLGGFGDDGTGDKKDDDGDGICDKNPGAALCKDKVPIDEDGTPDNANGVFDAQIQQLNDDSDALQAQISGRGWEVSDLGFSWSPGFPSGGSCTPAQFGSKATLDICEPLGKVRDLWAWAFAFLTGLYIWRRGASVQGA